MAEERSPLRVSLLALPEAMSFTLNGMYEVLGSFGLLATHDLALPRTPPFSVEIVALARGLTPTASGLPIEAHAAIDEVARTDLAIVPSVMVEGGGRLAGALLAAGLVDRYYWVQSPLWLGEQGIPAHAEVPSEPIAAVERWTVVERRALGDDTLLVVDRR